MWGNSWTLGRATTALDDVIENSFTAANAGILPETMASSDLLSRVDACVAIIRQRAPGFAPKAGLILGSGLGAFADSLERRVVIPYAELPDFPRSSVVGHAGQLVLGFHQGMRPVVTMQGRVHSYEGYLPWEVGFPTRVLCRLGIESLLVTNAAGGINAGFQVGDLMVITDHINLSGFNPLVGPNDDAIGPRFPDMSQAYDPGLLSIMREAAKVERVAIREGVYASVSGPSYETPAEIRMLRTLGADAVGMSTVPEVIVAAHMGVKVAGISCITNLAAGLSKQKLSHTEVSATADGVKDVFSRLVTRFLSMSNPDQSQETPPQRKS
jgi:purine-nucleoside phosphorylase